MTDNTCKDCHYCVQSRNVRNAHCLAIEAAIWPIVVERTRPACRMFLSSEDGKARFGRIPIVKKKFDPSWGNGFKRVPLSAVEAVPE